MLDYLTVCQFGGLVVIGGGIFLIYKRKIHTDRIAKQIDVTVPRFGKFRTNSVDRAHGRLHEVDIKRKEQPPPLQRIWVMFTALAFNTQPQALYVTDDGQRILILKLNGQAATPFVGLQMFRTFHGMAFGKTGAIGGRIRVVIPYFSCQHGNIVRQWP